MTQNAVLLFSRQVTNGTVRKVMSDMCLRDASRGYSRRSDLDERQREPMRTIPAGQPADAQVAGARVPVYGSEGWVRAVLKATSIAAFDKPHDTIGGPRPQHQGMPQAAVAGRGSDYARPM